MQLQMKRAAGDRENQNNEFQMTVTNLRDTLEMTIKALTKSLDALKADIVDMQLQVKCACEDRDK